MKRWTGLLKVTGLFLVILVIGLNISDPEKQPLPPSEIDTTLPETSPVDHTESKTPVLPPKAGVIETGMTTPGELLHYAKTLIGVPYLYASVDPAKGFDCSGFVTHVFNHFNIAVPRSSVDFTDVGREIDTSNARAGDLILFTGTDSTVRIVGHMGIIVSNENGKIQFIHSTSGKAMGVVISPFERYYRSRFVKVIRVFPES